MEAPRIEVVNLTRGILCPHLERKHVSYPIGNYRYARIQSTQCEMKQWDAVVATSFGPDLWMHLALGHQLVVHDYSERPRETRACWQGLTFIRYAAQRAWKMPITPAIGGKSAPFDMTDYFEVQFDESVSDKTKRMLKYYRNSRDQLGKRPPVLITSCYREERDGLSSHWTGWTRTSE